VRAVCRRPDAESATNRASLGPRHFAQRRNLPVLTATLVALDFGCDVVDWFISKPVYAVNVLG